MFEPDPQETIGPFRVRFRKIDSPGVYRISARNEK